MASWMLDRTLRNSPTLAHNNVPPTTGNTQVQWVQPSLEQTINAAFERMQANLQAEHDEPTQVMCQDQLRLLLTLVTFDDDWDDVTHVDIDVSGL